MPRGPAVKPTFPLFDHFDSLVLAFVIKPYPGRPSVPSHLQIRLWFIKVSQPTTQNNNSHFLTRAATKRNTPSAHPLYHRVCHSVNHSAYTARLVSTHSSSLSPLLYRFCLLIGPSPEIQTFTRRATRHQNIHILTHTGSMASTAGNIVPPPLSSTIAVAYHKTLPFSCLQVPLCCARC